MKKVLSVISVIQLITYSVVPIFAISAFFAGYYLSLRNSFVTAIATVIISAAACIVSFLNIDKSFGRIIRIVNAILLPMSVINLLCFLAISKSKIVFIIMLFSSVCTLIYILKCIYNNSTKVIASALSGFVIMALCFFVFISYFLGDVVCNTVVMKAYSPDNLHCAEVINNDQGALGGCTLVEVYNLRSGFDLYFFSVNKSPEQVFCGEWGEYYNMSIFWQNNQTLLINENKYTVD